MAMTIDVGDKLTKALEELAQARLLTQDQVGALSKFITMRDLSGLAAGSNYECLCKALAKVGAAASLYGLYGIKT